MSGALITIIIGWIFAISWIVFILFTQGKGHPKTLFLLFLTEMWERFSYYGMRTLLALYIVTEVSKGGLGWTNAQSGQLYGIYTGLFYFMTIFGGFLADKVFGFQRAIFIGGGIMVFGHGFLAIDSIYFFFGGLLLLILGGGLFKPNISSMVGQLYPANSPLKDSAYTIFYMGINMGGFLGSLTCGYLGEVINWHYGFGAAGIGMLLGLLIFNYTRKQLGTLGQLPVKQTADQLALEPEPALTKVEIDRLKVIAFLSFFSILFWTCFEQQAASMNIFAYKHTDRYWKLFDFEIPATFFQSVNPLFIIILAPLFSWIWVVLAKKNMTPAGSAKFGFGFLLLAIGFLFLVIGCLGIPKGSFDPKASFMWLVFAYFFQTAGELCLSPVGLSFVNKLAPKKFIGLMFGIWFVASALGSYSSGAISSLMDNFSLSAFWTISVVISLTGACLAFILSPMLSKWMHGVK